MKITSLNLQNYRSFESMDTIFLDNINVLVGANNSGKSSILKAINILLSGGGDYYADIRNKANAAEISLDVENIESVKANWSSTSRTGAGTIRINIVANQSLVINMSIIHTGEVVTFSQLQNIEPENIIVPFLSKRKMTTMLFSFQK